MGFARHLCRRGVLGWLHVLPRREWDSSFETEAGSCEIEVRYYARPWFFRYELYRHSCAGTAWRVVWSMPSEISIGSESFSTDGAVVLLLLFVNLLQQCRRLTPSFFCVSLRFAFLAPFRSSRNPCSSLFIPTCFCHASLLSG